MRPDARMAIVAGGVTTITGTIVRVLGQLLVFLVYGTLFSREQYLADVFRWGYADARMGLNGQMTTGEVSRWTAAIRKEKGGKHAVGDRR